MQNQFPQRLPIQDLMLREFKLFYIALGHLTKFKLFFIKLFLFRVPRDLKKIKLPYSHNCQQIYKIFILFLSM